MKIKPGIKFVLFLILDILAPHQEPFIDNIWEIKKHTDDCMNDFTRTILLLGMLILQRDLDNAGPMIFGAWGELQKLGPPKST